VAEKQSGKELKRAAAARKVQCARPPMRGTPTTLEHTSLGEEGAVRPPADERHSNSTLTHLARKVAEFAEHRATDLAAEATEQALKYWHKVGSTWVFSFHFLLL
jgi:hypothetical protein